MPAKPWEVSIKSPPLLLRAVVAFSTSDMPRAIAGVTAGLKCCLPTSLLDLKAPYGIHWLYEYSVQRQHRGGDTRPLLSLGLIKLD